MENMDNLIVEYNNDIEVEMAILALCMRKESALHTIQNQITPEDFTDERNSIIYGVILEMFFEGTKIDQITVYSELERRGIAEKIGGQRYVYRIGDTLAVQSALDSYIAALRERSDRKKILKTLETIRYQVFRGNCYASTILDNAITSFSQLKRDGETKGLVSMSDVLKSTVTEINNEIRDGDSVKVKLGYPLLDKMLGGLGPGTLHILGARPGMGKTALAINMATNVAANQKPVVVFSLEMRNEEIGKRLLSSAMTKPVSEMINSSKLTDSDIKQIDQALIKLRDYPIFFYDRADINPSTMKGLIQQLIAAGTAPKLIFVDYLQLVNMKGLPGRSRNDEVATISRTLKLLAKELEIPIIALSQLSRESAKRKDDHTPQLSDLRDSGAIEQDADTIMFVDRPGYYNTQSGNTPDGSGLSQTMPDSSGSNEAERAYIYLAKNRHGAIGKAPVWWFPKKTLFFEYNEKDPQDPNNQLIRSIESDAAAQSYDFNDDKDDEQAMDPPLSEDENAGQAEDEFMADTHDDLPDGFFDEHV